MKNLTRLTWLDVSRHRPVLYGFAALWIAVFHMEYRIPFAFLGAFQTLGACGVEIFVLLTGAGLYRSMERDSNVRQFYRKRFTRVFLPAVIVSLLHFSSQPGSILRTLACSMFFPYWLGIDTFWYVAFILTMYLFYPFIYRLQKAHPRLLWALLAASVLGALAVSAIPCEWTEVCARGVTRIPAFLLGCILAPRLERGMEFPRWLMPICFCGFFAFRFLAVRTAAVVYFWRMAAYICLAAFLILLIVRLCRHCVFGAPGRFIYRCFAFCGGISLEIYLLFGRLRRWTVLLPDYASGKIGMLKLELFTLLLTLLISWLLTLMCQRLTRDFARLNAPTD